MKKLFLLLFLFNFSINAQEKIEDINTVDQVPKLQDCLLSDKHDKNCFLATFQKYISERLILPFDSLNNPIEGKAKAYLIFHKNGTLQVKIIRSKNKILSEHTKKLFTDFPVFKPAIKNGNPVPMIFVYPISYVFTIDPNKYYSIKEVSPPQLKIYKSKKKPSQLTFLYNKFISDFIIKSKQQGHSVSKDTNMHFFAFEIDTLGQLGNFTDLIEPNSISEKYFNKKALKKGNSFKIPAKIGNRAVKIRDTIQLLGVIRERRTISSGLDKARY